LDGDLTTANANIGCENGGWIVAVSRPVNQIKVMFSTVQWVRKSLLVR